MRIVHISTTDLQGGAARAAYRLAVGLRRAGQDCAMLVKHKSGADAWVHGFAPLDRAQEEEAGRVWKNYIYDNRTPVSNTHFSLPAPGCDVASHPAVREADVVHLHWVAGFVAPAGVRRLQDLGKTVVWTLHDQRPFTGGCHYAAGCDQYERQCDQCPQLRADELGLVPASFAEALEQLRPGLGVICLSRWMADCARRSRLLRTARVEIIPNGLDTEVFRPGREAARAKLKWDREAVYFLFGADYLTEKRKGFDTLRGAVGRCLAKEPFRAAAKGGRIWFVFFGELPAAAIDMGFPAQALGRVEAEAALAEIYAACDAFILPSYEDNLPNTMLEAMCCGTPVIGAAVGGVAETIENGVTGLLTPPGDEAALADAIEALATDAGRRAALSANCARQAPAAFGWERQAEHCRRFYAEEMARQQGRAAAGPAPPSSFGAFFPRLAARVAAAEKPRPRPFWRRWF